MYDYNQMMSNMYGEQTHFASYMGPKVELELFSPKLLPTQVLRSYVFDLGNQFQEHLFNSGAGSFQEAVAPAGAKGNPAVATAIVPTDNGTRLNTSELSQTWSFVLIIDDAPANHMRHAAPSTRHRFIASGYVAGLNLAQAEEPVNYNPLNPEQSTINPNAMLVFTHATSTWLSSEYGTRSGQHFAVSQDADLITATNAAIVDKNEPMFVGLGHELLNNIVDSHPNEMCATYGNLSLDSETIVNSALAVKTQLKSPQHHLINMMQAIDSAKASAEDHFVRSAIMPNNSNTIGDTMREAIVSNMPTMYETLPKSGIDTSQPMPLGKLVQMYPNIHIFPRKVPITSEWGVTPQDIISLENKMSSLVAATVSSIAPLIGIANIAFRYNSWIKDNPFMVNWENDGTWAIYEPTGFLTVMDDATKLNNLRFFKQVVYHNLFPTIKALGGEFDLYCFYNMTGEILVKLHYQDFVGESGGDGFYETNGRLGGLTNPMIGTLGVINNNAAMLNHLVSSAVTREFGPNAFGDPSNKQINQFNEEPVYPPFGGYNTGNVPIAQPVQQQAIVPDFTPYSF